MLLSDFSALIEIATTLNLAFVAVEVYKGYPRLLSDNIFNITPTIRAKRLNISRKVNNYNKTACALADTVSGSSVVIRKEEIKLGCEQLEKDNKNTFDTLNRAITEKCDIKTFSAICLFAALGCFVSLFANGFTDLHLPISILSVFILLYSIIGALQIKKVDTLLYSKLTNTVYTFLICLVLSFLVWLCIYCKYPEILSEINSILKGYSLPVISIIPFIHFIIFFFIVKKRAKEAFALINEQYSSLEDSLKEIETKLNKLTDVFKFHKELAFDNMQSDKEPTKDQ